MASTRKLAPVIVLLALLLSGCAGQGPITRTPTVSAPTESRPNPTLPPTINQSADLFSLEPGLVECQYFIATIQAPADDVQSLVPPGYVVDTTGALANVLLEVDLCKSININNETVIPNAGILVVRTPVSVNETIGAGVDSFYALELLTTNETMTNLFRALGFKASTASIVIAAGPPITLEVGIDGQSWYDATSVRWTPYTVPESRTLRYHQVGTAGSVRWFDYHRNDEIPSEYGPTTINASGGVLRDLDPTNQGTIPARARLGVSGGTLGFGRLG